MLFPRQSVAAGEIGHLGLRFVLVLAGVVRSTSIELVTVIIHPKCTLVRTV